MSSPGYFNSSSVCLLCLRCFCAYLSACLLNVYYVYCFVLGMSLISDVSMCTFNSFSCLCYTRSALFVDILWMLILILLTDVHLFLFWWYRHQAAVCWNINTCNEFLTSLAAIWSDQYHVDRCSFLFTGCSRLPRRRCLSYIFTIHIDILCSPVFGDLVREVSIP